MAIPGKYSLLLENQNLVNLSSCYIIFYALPLKVSLKVRFLQVAFSANKFLLDCVLSGYKLCTHRQFIALLFTCLGDIPRLGFPQTFVINCIKNSSWKLCIERVMPKNTRLMNSWDNSSKATFGVEVLLRSSKLQGTRILRFLLV